MKTKQTATATAIIRDEFMAGLREGPAVFFWRWLSRTLMDMLPPRQEHERSKRRGTPGADKT